MSADNKERARQRRLETARDLEARGHVDHAVTEFLKAKVPGEAARVLAKQGRLADAGQAILDGLGVKQPSDVAGLSRGDRDLVRQAQLFFEHGYEGARAEQLAVALAAAPPPDPGVDDRALSALAATPDEIPAKARREPSSPAPRLPPEPAPRPTDEAASSPVQDPASSSPRAAAPSPDGSPRPHSASPNVGFRPPSAVTSGSFRPPSAPSSGSFRPPSSSGSFRPPTSSGSSRAASSPSPGTSDAPSSSGSFRPPFRPLVSPVIHKDVIVPGSPEPRAPSPAPASEPASRAPEPEPAPRRSEAASPEAQDQAALAEPQTRAAPVKPGPETAAPRSEPLAPPPPRSEPAPSSAPRVPTPTPQRSSPPRRPTASSDPVLSASGEVITDYAGDRAQGWRGGGGEAIEASIEEHLAAGRKGAAARIARDAGQYDRALVWFVELDLYHQAGACLRSIGRYDEALAMLLRQDIKGPNYRKACFELVGVAIELGRLDFDIDRFLSAFVEAGPADRDEIETYFGLAQLYLANDFTSGAKRCLRKVLASDPAHAQAKALDKDLRRSARASSSEAPRAVLPASARGLPPLPSLEEFIALARAHIPSE